jgi:hypothetical protein
MKQYPTIPGGVHRGVPVYVFDKLDGSNVRAEWSRKAGWYKFGRRHGLLDDTNPILAREARDLMLNSYSDDLAAIFRKQRWDRVIAFFEFWGESSFAGNHEEEPHQVTLIDVSVHRKGILEPRTFLKLFDGLSAGLPALLHHGNFTADLQGQVEDGTLEGMTYEGIVAKGKCTRPGRPLMFKRKSRAGSVRQTKSSSDGDRC